MEKKPVVARIEYSIIETTDFFSSDFILNFLFFSLFLIPSIAGLLCCRSFFCGHTHLLSVLGNSDFFQSLLIEYSYRLCLHTLTSIRWS